MPKGNIVSKVSRESRILLLTNEYLDQLGFPHLTNNAVAISKKLSNNLIVPRNFCIRVKKSEEKITPSTIIEGGRILKKEGCWMNLYDEFSDSPYSSTVSGVVTYVKRSRPCDFIYLTNCEPIKIGDVIRIGESNCVVADIFDELITYQNIYDDDDIYDDRMQFEIDVIGEYGLFIGRTKREPCFEEFTVREIEEKNNKKNILVTCFIGIFPPHDDYVNIDGLYCIRNITLVNKGRTVIRPGNMFYIVCGLSDMFPNIYSTMMSEGGYK